MTVSLHRIQTLLRQGLGLPCWSSVSWLSCRREQAAYRTAEIEYDSEIESCHTMYDDPDDADDLRMCIQNARD